MIELDHSKDIWEVKAVWLINTADNGQEAIKIAEKMGLSQAASVKTTWRGKPSYISARPTGPVRED